MFPQLLSAINQVGGGVSLAPEPTGGSFSPSPVFQQNNNSEVRAYVVESDISDNQKRVNSLRESSEF